MYVKVKNGVIEQYPYSINQLRADNPQTSFPADPTTALLEEWGVYPVTSRPRPTADHTKTVTELQPEMVEGVWTQVWTVTDTSTEELAILTASESIRIRQQRNRMLANSDWTQVADSPVDKTAWAVYRQALRDVPDQSGFPWTVTWPEEP